MSKVEGSAFVCVCVHACVCARACVYVCEGEEEGVKGKLVNIK